jgi:hypothetical protein
MKRQNLAEYAENRQRVLDEITQKLSMDERFAAAWLTGSFARGEADVVSDLDLTGVVREPFSERLCERQEMASGTTTTERMELFSQFGPPALIHENHHNAPAGGTFTFVLYAGSALMVDWVLLPLASARRPETSRLLFDDAGIPLQKPERPEKPERRLEKIREMTAFFWMMTAVTIKYIQRGDGVFVQTWLENLTGLVNEIERQMEGKPVRYHRGSMTKPTALKEEQIKAIRDLCRQMSSLSLRVNELAGQVPSDPLQEIEGLLKMIE